MPVWPEPVAAPRVLMLHGAGGGGWEWNRWRPVWEAHGWEVDAPDLQPAAAGLAATTLDDYAEQLAERVERHPPQVLVGASLGGLLCLQQALTRAGPALILLNPLPPAPESALLPRVEPSPERVAWSSGGRFAGTHDALEDAAASARLFAYRHWRDESGRVLNAARGGVHLVEGQLSACLVVASTHDEDVPVGCSAALAQRLGASLLRIPGTHLSPLLGDRAHEAAEYAVGWLNTQDGFRSN